MIFKGIGEFEVTTKNGEKISTYGSLFGYGQIVEDFYPNGQCFDYFDIDEVELIEADDVLPEEVATINDYECDWEIYDDGEDEAQESIMEEMKLIA